MRGGGGYVDDLKVPNVLHAVFVRSPHAHAAIRQVDFTSARSVSGVVACYAAADLGQRLTRPRMPLAFPKGQLPDEAMPYVLARREACYVGEAVAMVVAESRRVAEDAAGCVEVEYEPLPPVVDPRTALDSRTPRACADTASNIFKRIRAGYGDVASGFERAHRTFRIEYFQHRGSGQPMETRGVLAVPDPTTGGLTVWSSTQKAYSLWSDLCIMLGMDENRVRVITPDVGGGFGTKFTVYPEEIAVPAVAVHLGRPVKWIEDRAEHFLSAIQERDQFLTLEAAVDAGGKLLALRGRLVQDQGAYAPHNVVVPYNSGTMIPGPYVLPALDMDIVVAQTNKPPVIPVRGAGYPQACFAMERLMDTIAADLGIDRAEVRARNYIGPEQIPYTLPLRNRAGAGTVYDSGDFPACQEEALRAADYAGFRQRQAKARAEGRFFGIGLAACVKGTGRGPFESGIVRVAPTGKVSIFTGAHEMGQGIKTALAELCADTLGVRIEDVNVIAADTAFAPLGQGGYASRQLVTAGSSVLIAAKQVRAHAIKVASQMLEAAESDLEIIDGRIHVAGVAGHGVTLGEVAEQLRGQAGYAYPAGVDVGLEASHYFRTDSLTYANAFHVCELEVDAETGAVHILRYVALQDSGRLINPLIVEGQIHGSVAHGIGNALFEYMRYDETGQPLTTTFADYLLPTAHDVPKIEVLFHETPTPSNPLGAKGAGEVSLIPVTATVISAVENALEAFGVRIYECPISPVRIVELIRSARSRQRENDSAQTRAHVREKEPTR